MSTARSGDGHSGHAHRPRAALAMSRETAEGLLSPSAVSALSAHVELAPLPVLDDFTTERSHRVLATTELLITGWGCPPVDQAALAAAPRLRAIAHLAGTVRHHVTAACWERGIEVSSAAAANALPVAEYTVAMILLAGKRVLETARHYRARRARVDWSPVDHPQLGNYGTSVGILSASLIGRRVIELLRPYSFRVLLYDPYLSAAEAAALGVQRAQLPEVFAASDVISVHTPLLPETRGLVNRELLAAMRQDATLINTARGAVVDPDALTDALMTGRIRAVLDVTEPEVLPPDHPLWECEHVLLTPHLAGSQGNELRRLVELTASEVRRWATGEGFAHPVLRERLAFLA